MTDKHDLPDGSCKTFAKADYDGDLNAIIDSTREILEKCSTNRLLIKEKLKEHRNKKTKKKHQVQGDATERFTWDLQQEKNDLDREAPAWGNLKPIKNVFYRKEVQKINMDQIQNELRQLIVDGKKELKGKHFVPPYHANKYLTVERDHQIRKENLIRKKKQISPAELNGNVRTELEKHKLFCRSAIIELIEDKQLAEEKRRMLVEKDESKDQRQELNWTFEKEHEEYNSRLLSLLNAYNPKVQQNKEQLSSDKYNVSKLQSLSIQTGNSKKKTKQIKKTLTPLSKPKTVIRDFEPPSSFVGEEKRLPPHPGSLKKASESKSKVISEKRTLLFSTNESRMKDKIEKTEWTSPAKNVRKTSQKSSDIMRAKFNEELGEHLKDLQKPIIDIQVKQMKEETLTDLSLFELVSKNTMSHETIQLLSAPKKDLLLNEQKKVAPQYSMRLHPMPMMSSNAAECCERAAVSTSDCFACLDPGTTTSEEVLCCAPEKEKVNHATEKMDGVAQNPMYFKKIPSPQPNEDTVSFRNHYDVSPQFLFPTTQPETLEAQPCTSTFTAPSILEEPFLHTNTICCLPSESRFIQNVLEKDPKKNDSTLEVIKSSSDAERIKLHAEQESLWIACTDEFGSIYYLSTISGDAQWDKPFDWKEEATI